ncbi:MAG: methyltransferase domain-containing protein [Phycisphaerales bacterium]
MAKLSVSTQDISQRPRLHLGCGDRAHPEWINADLNPTESSILPIDATKPLPFADDSFDAVYHAHMLEHLTPDAGQRLIMECARVLRPGGVLRVTVPDLETLARNYISALDNATSKSAAHKIATRNHSDTEPKTGTETAPVEQHRYDWSVIELIDQMVRTTPGGEMLKCWSEKTVPAEDLIIERMGEQYTQTRKAIQDHRAALGTPPAWTIQDPDSESPERISKFLLAGERHRWMYDRYSLARLLTRAGLSNPLVRSPQESSIAGWSQFELEIDDQGRPSKPDSLAMEATQNTH